MRKADGAVQDDVGIQEFTFQLGIIAGIFQKKDYIREVNGSSAGSTNFHHTHD